MLLRRIILIILFFGSIVIAPQWAHALTRQLPLSGQLLTPAKTAVPDGDYTMRFAIYDKDRTASDPYPSDMDSTARIWTETQTVKVERGLWKATLGSVTDLPGTLNFETGNYYLGIRINTDPEMVPRKKILPVPQALNSESVGGAKPGTGNNNILQLDSAGTINIAGNITTAGILQGANLIVGTAIQLPANSILTADIMDGAISTIDLADGVITSVKISDSSIASAKLSDGAISNAKIANDAVGTNHIIDGAVAVSKIADGAITTIKISDGSVATSKISDLAVTTLKIADSAITAAKLADSSITTAKIADTSITAAKLFTGDLHFQNTDTGTTSLSFGLGTGTAIGTNNFSLTASNAANKPAVRYNGATGKWQISNDGTTFADIGSSLSSSLQAGYDAGNTITTTDARNILFTLADTATDSNFLINIQGTGNSFQIQDAGTPIFTVADGGLSTFGGNINLSGNRIVSTSRIDGYASGTFLYTAVDVRSAGSYSSLALDSSNYPHIAYYTNDSSAATIADWDGTQWTVTDFDTAGTRGYNMDLVIDGAGVKHVVYEEQITADSNLIYAKYVGSGGTGCASAAWSCTTVDSTGDVGRGVNSIDVDGSNVPHISYYDTTNGDLKHAWYVGSGGTGCASAAWSCEVVESANTIGSASAIAINRANGDIHISYYDTTNGDLRYIKYSGGAWSTPVNLDGSAGCIATGCGTRDAGNYSYGSSLTLNASGNPRVAYLDDTGDDLYYAYSNDGGATWTTTKIDGGAGVTGTGCATSGNYGQYPSLTLDSGGNPHISYYNYSTYDLRYASNNGSAWTCQTLDSANTVGLYSSIKMTSADKAYISYQDSTNVDLKIVSNNYPKLNIYSDVAIMGETGNLGIGVLQPTERLDVAGNIKATGNITSSLSVVAGSGFSTTSGSNYIPTIYGGSSASGNFTLSSTSSSTRGNVFINPGGKFTVIGNSIASASIANAGLQITPNYLFLQYRYYNPGTGYTYSGNAAEANSYGGTAFTLVSAVGDMAYFGSYQPFGSLEVDLAALGAGGAVAWEYWNGAWVSLTATDGTINFTADGVVSFTPPADWVTTYVNNSTNIGYWIRARTTTLYTTAPTANSTIIGQFGSAAAPLVASLIQPAGIADSTTWSATGTMLGINTPSSFDGNLVDLKVAGSSKFVINSSGNVGIGMAVNSTSKLSIGGVAITNNDIAGIQESIVLSGLGSVSLYGNKLDVVASGVSGSPTFYGQVITVTDNSLSGPNAAYGLFVDNTIGVNTADERYGIIGTSKGVGVLGKSDGSSGSPTQYGDGTNAAVFAQYSGITAGNALRAYSNTITSSNLFALNQNTSAFSGNMLFANMANASGSFTGNFVDFQVNSVNKFKITNSGANAINLGAGTLSGNLDIRQIADGNQVIYARRNTDTTPTGNFVQFQNAAGSATLFGVDINGNIIAKNGSTGIDAGCLAGETLNSITVSGGVVTAGTCTANAADLAEYYKGNAVEVGDVVMLLENFGTSNGDPDFEPTVKKSETPYQNALLGVVSTKPGIVLGKKSKTSVPIALAGRVPVKVSLENGPIAVGDPLTSSSTPGVAMKATGTGYVIGKALESFDLPDPLLTKEGQGVVGKILVFVNPGWYAPPAVYATQGGEAEFAKINIGEMAAVGDLVVAKSARFEGTLTVLDDAIFAGNVLAKKEVRVGGKIIAADVDMSGGLIVQKSARFENDLEILGTALFRGPAEYDQTVKVGGGLEVQGQAKFAADINVIGNIAADKGLFNEFIVSGSAVINGDLSLEGKVVSDLKIEKDLIVKGLIKAKGIVGGWRSYENHFLNSKFENDFTASLRAAGESAASWEYHKIKLVTDALAGSKATLDHSFNFKPADDEIGASWRFMIKTEHLNDLPNLLLIKEGRGVVRFGLYGDEQNYVLIQNGAEPQTIKFISCAVGECTTTDNIAIDPSLENHNYIIMIKAGEAKLLIDGQEFAKHSANIPADSILHFYEEVSTNVDSVRNITLDYLGVIVGRYEPF